MVSNPLEPNVEATMLKLRNTLFRDAATVITDDELKFPFAVASPPSKSVAADEDKQDEVALLHFLVFVDIRFVSVVATC